MVFPSHRCQNVENVQETFINTKNSLLKPFLDHRVQNVPEVSSKPRLEENKVEFLEIKFHDKELSFVHKKKTEHSFELSLSILCLLSEYFQS